MSAIRLLIIRIITLFAFIILSGNGLMRAQVDIITPNLVSRIDTSDYFPSIYPSALDNNLMIAASKGYTSEIRRLIAKGANINSQTTEGATPLIFAVTADNLFAVATLLMYNPDIEKITHNNETALMIAAKNGYLEIAEALIRAGADMEYTDIRGVTPLHYAALYNYFEMVDLFIYYDTPLDLKTDEGTTPLLAAIWAGNTDVADLLIQHGAQTEISDNDGFTPFLLASFYGDTLLMDILYKKGANIYATNKAKHNALTIAISTGDKTTTEFLLKMGDKWTEQISNSWDPYVVASKYRRNDMVEILKQYKVPGELKYGIDQVALTASTRMYTHNLITGLSLSFKEPNLNAGITFGCDVKLWYSRLLLKESENSYYQYMVKESMVYGGVFKDFPLTDNLNTFNYSLSTSLYAGYTFGNNLKGTLIQTGNQFKVIPAVTFKMTKHNLTLMAGIEYIKTDFYQNGPVWFRLGAAYNYFFDNIRIKVKPIKWQ
jgi:ankyrin repeat protein